MLIFFIIPFCVVIYYSFISRAKMSADQLKQKQEKADDIMRANWKVEDGLLVYEGHSFDNLCSRAP